MNESCEILIVDDEKIVGERLKAALQREGHKVAVLVDPVEALRLVDSRHFDIVICDVRMGEVDGLQVLARTLESSSRTKVIMITGYATLELARESLTKGAFDFIAKPFKLGEIRKTVNRAIETIASDGAVAGTGGL